jgi:phosphoglucomutase
MIRFGTAGWRGVVGQDFTFGQVRLLLSALAELLRQEGERGPVLVAYDTRLLSARLASEAVDVLTHHGFPTVLADRDLPAPALSWAVRHRGAAAGVMFTASHNPPEYNGVKLYTKEGVLAPKAFTQRLENLVAALAAKGDAFFVRQASLATTQSFSEDYRQALEAHVDWEAVRRLPGKVVVDPLFGTSRDFLDRVFVAQGIPIRVIHATKDPYFGGYAPECSPQNLAVLRETVRQEGAFLGLATDGDADRFGIVDRSCRVLMPNLVLAALVDYLAARGRLTRGVARTVATTRLLDRVARARKLDLVETEVGFPSLGPLLLSGRVEVAVEESAGLGVASHLPERDGIFACLLVAEMVGATGQSLGLLVRSLFQRYGTLFSRRVQLPLREESPAALTRLQGKEFREFAGLPVVGRRQEEGLLLQLAGEAWVLWRLSGTEPKVRLYAEAPSTELLRALVREAKRVFRQAEEEVRHV